MAFETREDERGRNHTREKRDVEALRALIVNLREIHYKAKRLPSDDVQTPREEALLVELDRALYAVADGDKKFRERLLKVAAECKSDDFVRADLEKNEDFGDIETEAFLKHTRQFRRGEEERDRLLADIAKLRCCDCGKVFSQVRESRSVPGFCRKCAKAETIREQEKVRLLSGDDATKVRRSIANLRDDSQWVVSPWDENNLTTTRQMNELRRIATKLRTKYEFTPSSLARACGWSRATQVKLESKAKGSEEMRIPKLREGLARVLESLLPESVTRPRNEVD